MPVNSFQDYPMAWRPSRAQLGDGPIYLALAARLESDIVSGALAAGTRLPPQRELADFLDLDFTTVTRAYGVCREKGLVRGVVGRGTFVIGGEAAAGSPAIADCAVVQGFPEIGGRIIAAAAQKVLARESAERLFSYAARDGQPNHLASGARWLARCGVAAPVDCVSVFPGVQSALSTALLSLFRPGEALAVDRYTYANLIELAHLAHIRLVAIAGDERGMVPEALREAAVKDAKIRGVYLMPTCANPTTITLDEGRKDALARVCDTSDLMILEDDAALVAAKRGKRTFCARLPERTVYLAGSIRALAPGLRVTYVAAPASCNAALRQGLHHLSIKASALEAAIVGELVTSGRAEEILAAKRAQARESNRVFDRLFGKDGGDPTRFFRTIPHPNTAGRGAGIEARLAQAGVRACHSDRFAVRTHDPDTFLRISLSSEMDVKKLEAGLRTIRAVLARDDAPAGGPSR